MATPTFNTLSKQKKVQLRPLKLKCNTSWIMHPRQLLLGKEVLELLILQVSEQLTASSSQTAPPADRACQESALEAPPFSGAAVGLW